MNKKNITYFISICFLGLLSCNTPKDPAPPIPIFNAGDLVGKWKLVAGSADIGGGAIVITDIFDRTNFLLAVDTTGFCSQNAILDLQADSQFAETSNCYQSIANKTWTGVYTFRQEAATFVLTYNAEAKITPRAYRITELSAKEMKVNYSDTRQGIVFLSKLTYQR
ncbi:hypothetical protein [Thermoflexibacter ruber]|uniref:Lipocalin-like domain-containing protein n=1 Tax=Thermoflexibacter ruber TaxID=1003 RepID=A0A1I2H7J1_9BACT|nr:hypothetical protein [Thermoflexibacter ruber]SFF25333.1 hypothetical protein SAMN04488541_10227 [Thermoflexibacter ruber]